MKIIKKHQKLIVFVITCLSIYFIYNYSGEQNKITYITLGDGYAEGLNSYQQPSYGYSDYLKDYYEERDELKFYYDGYTNKEMTLKDLKKDHTILMITHKPELMKSADDILVIDHGKIVGRGKHSELIKNNTYYQKLHK